MPGRPVRTPFCKRKEWANSFSLSLGWSNFHLWQVKLPWWILSSTLAPFVGIGFFYSSQIFLFRKMLTPSRSRSSARGDEGYFEWCENMERQQRESERQVQALLQETRRLREENVVLRIQVSSEPPPCQQPRSPGCNQEAMYPKYASPLVGMHGAWLSEEPIHVHRAPREESFDSTRISSKSDSCSVECLSKHL